MLARFPIRLGAILSWPVRPQNLHESSDLVVAIFYMAVGPDFDSLKSTRLFVNVSADQTPQVPTTLSPVVTRSSISRSFEQSQQQAVATAGAVFVVAVGVVFPVVASSTSRCCCSSQQSPVSLGSLLFVKEVGDPFQSKGGWILNQDPTLRKFAKLRSRL